jgi:tripartite-type tricarboxylate transporter receptor subunit TctC
MLIGRRAALAAPFLALGGGAARAAWPEKPIRLVVPFAPGGGVDLTGRVMAEALEPRLGQPLVVENRSGAGGAVGLQTAMAAPADGYTLAVTSPSTIVTGPLLRPPAYDPFALTHVVRVCTSPLLLVVRPGLGVTDLAGFIALARREPGGLKVANSGPGTVIQMGAELFNQRLGVDRFTHVLYRGTGPAVADMIGGSVDAFFSDATVMGFVAAGQLRLLAVTSLAPWPGSPQTPLVASTLPGFEVINWYGLVAPPGLPAPVLARLETASTAALADPAVVKRLSDIGLDAAPLGAVAFREFLLRERAMWAGVIQRAGITLD